MGRMKPFPVVNVGDVWRSGRPGAEFTLKVEEVDEFRAYYRNRKKNGKPGARRSILIRRMKPGVRGFVLVKAGMHAMKQEGLIEDEACNPCDEDEEDEDCDPEADLEGDE